MIARAPCLLLGLAVACRSRARPAVVHDAAPEYDAEPAAAVGLFDAGDVEVALEQRTGPAQSGNVIYLDLSTTASTLVVTSHATAPVQLAVPPYLYARLPGYQYPYGDEGCLPADQFLIAAPAEAVEVAPGGHAELRVTESWYLGNAERPPPMASVGPLTTLAVRAAPTDDPLVRLADTVRATPEIAGGAFAIAGGCSPEPWLTESMLQHTSGKRISQIEAAFRSAGIDPATAPVFAAARKKRADAIAQLTADLDTYHRTHDLTGLAILYDSADPAFLAFFAGDPEIQALAMRYLEPDHPKPVEFLLEQLRQGSTP